MGIGALDLLLLPLNFVVREYAVLSAPAEVSPALPMRFGVAAEPTQRPISKGHVPSRGSCARSSSSAHISVAARPSWSSVSSRRV